MKKIFKKIALFFKIIVVGFVMFLFINSITSLINKKIPSILNYNFFIVQTNSMEDSINVNDLVISKISKIEDVKENDIITFICIDDTQVVVNQVITHRVIKVENIDGVIYLTTKGDNNPINDTYKVTSENFLGKVVVVLPLLGKIISTFSSVKMLIILIITLISLTIMITQLKNYLNTKKEKERKEKLKQEILMELKKEENNGK